MSAWPLHFRVRVFITGVLQAVGPKHVRAHKHWSQHRSEIERSVCCGCSYCFETFSPKEIDEWIDEGETAMCPRCGIDAVMGSASGFSLSHDFLQRMHRYWFERTIRVKLRSASDKNRAL